MVWQPEVDELKRRRQLAEQMGGPEAVARHHARGKLTVRERVAALADPETKREEIEARLKAIASPFRTAEAFNIEDIIDPRDTRPLLCDFVEMAQKEIKRQLGPVPGYSYRP